MPSMRKFVFMSEQDGNIPQLNEFELINYTLDCVELAFQSNLPIDTGKLYITSSRVLWIGENKKYDFDIQFIILHAVTHDPSSYPRPCLYCQFDVEEDEFHGDNDDEINHAEDENPCEMFLCPQSGDDLMSLFNAFSKAALDNPDDTIDEFDSELIYNLDEVQIGAQEMKTLEHLDSLLPDPEETNMN